MGTGTMTKMADSVPALVAGGVGGEEQRISWPGVDASLGSAPATCASSSKSLTSLSLFPFCKVWQWSLFISKECCVVEQLCINGRYSLFTDSRFTNPPTCYSLFGAPKLPITGLTWSFANRHRAEKKLSRPACLIPAEVKQGGLLPPSVSTQTVSKCLFRGPFSLKVFTLKCFLLVILNGPEHEVEMLSSAQGWEGMCLKEKTRVK